MNDIHRLLIIIAIAFLALPHLDVPIQPVSEDPRPQAKHLIDKMLILVGVMLL
jgi:hypothetical protein